MTRDVKMVEWDKLDQATFDRFVDTLLTRVHTTDDPSCEVNCVDGRGGDGGVDIEVLSHGILQDVYQLKFFPEGFSGGWAKSRKAQIRGSFLQAMKKTPRTWTLVVPRNLTPGELDFVRSLKGRYSVKIRVLGRARLDDMMARFPDLQRWAVLEPLTDALKSIHLDRALLLEPNELHDAVRVIHDRVEARSPHWSVSGHYERGSYFETMVPKHGRAQEFEPIGLKSASFEIPDDDPDLAERARLVLGYGDEGSLTLPSTHVKDLVFEAPSWSPLSTVKGAESVTISKENSGPGAEVELRIVDDDDIVMRSYSGQVTHVGSGALGGVFRAKLGGGVDLRLSLDRDSEDDVSHGTATFTQALNGLTASDAERGTHLVADMMKSHKVQVYLDGAHMMTFRGGGSLRLSDENPGARERAFQVLLIEDLALIERELGLQIVVPDMVAPNDRLTIRIVRLLLEGHIVINPFIGGFECSIEYPDLAGHVESLRNGVGPVSVAAPGSTVDILGRRVALGPEQLVIRNAVIVDFAKLVDAIEAGEKGPTVVSFRAPSNEGVKVFLPSRLDVASHDGTITPWGIDELQEHLEFRGLTPPPSVATSVVDSR